LEYVWSTPTGLSRRWKLLYRPLINGEGLSFVVALNHGITRSPNTLVVFGELEAFPAGRALFLKFFEEAELQS
jgi:hypothetical protein